MGQPVRESTSGFNTAGAEAGARVQVFNHFSSTCLDNAAVDRGVDGAVYRAAIAAAQGGALPSDTSDEVGGGATSMADRRLASMRAALVGRGLFLPTVETILRQWRSKQMNVHRRYFCNYWVPWCICWGQDPFAYSVSAVANCLNFQQERAAALAISKGKSPQHGGLKALRAAISETLKIIHGKRISLEPDVAALAITARHEAPNSRKYTECFHISIVWTYYSKQYERGWDNDSMSMDRLRSKMLVLCRIKCANRSDDMSKILRIFNCDGCQLRPAGLFGNKSRGPIEKWRYYEPKQARVLAGKFTRWCSLGEYLPTKHRAVCARSAAEAYLRRTKDLQRADSDDGFVLSLIPRPGTTEFYSVGSDRIRNVTKIEMQCMGVDVEKYQGHVLRHLSLSHAAASGMNKDKFLLGANMSGPIFEKFYRVEIEMDEDLGDAPYLLPPADCTLAVARAMEPQDAD
jgi:hypothetical protein